MQTSSVIPHSRFRATAYASGAASSNSKLTPSSAQTSGQVRPLHHLDTPIVPQRDRHGSLNKHIDRKLERGQFVDCQTVGRAYFYQTDDGRWHKRFRDYRSGGEASKNIYPRAN